jgi:hypothetical protein
MTSYDDGSGVRVDLPPGTLRNLLGDRAAAIDPETVTIRRMPSGDYLVGWAAFRIVPPGHPIIRAAGLEGDGVRVVLESRAGPEDDPL